MVESLFGDWYMKLVTVSPAADLAINSNAAEEIDATRI